MRPVTWLALLPFIGILTGEAVVAIVSLSHQTVGTIFPFLPQWGKDLNVGIVAMILNLIVTFGVSAFTKKVEVSVVPEVEA